MASLVSAGDKWSAEYHGLPSIFEFTNADGQLPRVNCGQAAAATLLAFYGKVSPATQSPSQIVTNLEKGHPPDNLAGIFGSSRRRITRIFRRRGVRIRVLVGEEDLRETVSQGQPVIVVIGVRAGTLFHRFDLPGGHWTVAYGFDGEHIYLTNYGRMTWDDFRRAWMSFVPRLIDMHGKGLVAVS
jgi:hypothetical protein